MIASNKFRSALRIRIGQFPHSITYPYGQDKFEALQPLSKSQREDFRKAQSEARILESIRIQEKQDKITMWVCLAALIAIYCALDGLLLAWLSGF